eukprot:gene6255-10263_t
MGNQASINFSDSELHNNNIEDSPKTTKDFVTSYNHLNNSIVLFGGYPGIDTSIYELNLKTKTWKKPPISGKPPSGRFGHTAVLRHENWFIFGGEDGTTKNKLNDLYMLDLEHRKWSKIETTGNPPAPRKNHSAAWHLNNNSMIIYGGEQSSKKIFSDCHMYDFSTMKWTQIILKNSSFMNIGLPKRTSHSVCMFDNYMMIFGGKDKEGLQNDTFVINFDKSSISKLKTKNNPTKRNRAKLLTRSGIFIVFGGYSGTVRKPQNDLYFMRMDNLKWVKIPLNEEIRKNYIYQMMFFQGQLHLIGGDNDGEFVDQMLTSNIDEYIRVMSVPYSEIKIDKYIAEDSYSKIYSGTWRNQTVAIKVLKDSDPEKMKKLLEHTKTLKKLKHPNILDFKCFVAEDPHFCLVLRLLKGSLSHLFHVQKFKPEIDFMIKIGLQISLGLKYLYSWKLIYGVLNTRKILIDGDHCVLSDHFLTDKSHLAESQNQQELTPPMIEKVFGSIYFVAPELLKGEKPTEKSDMYSVGTVLWEMYSGEDISRKEINTKELLPKFIKGKKPCSNSNLEDLIIHHSEDFKLCEYLKLIKDCWNEDPSKRPSIDYLVEFFKIHSTDQFNKFNTNQNNSGNSNDKKNDSTGIKSDKYETIKQIGIGGQARVFLVKNKSTNQSFALKKFQETPIEELNNDLQEMRSYVGMNHPNILSIHDFFISMDSETTGNCHLNIVMDYCDSGDLYKIIQQKEKISIELLNSISMQIFDGIAYIHAKKIVHRDLKPNNVMLLSDNTIKIGDLGLAKSTSDNVAKTFCGTIEYMSPEQRSGLPYDTSVDIWACGMILFELITKKRLEYSKFMKEKKVYLEKEMKDFLGNEKFKLFFKIIEDCLIFNPDQRPTAQYILRQLRGEEDEEKSDLISSDLIDDSYQFNSLSSQSSMMSMTNEKILHEQPSFLTNKSSGSELDNSESEVISDKTDYSNDEVHTSNSFTEKRKSSLDQKRVSFKSEKRNSFRIESKSSFSDHYPPKESILIHEEKLMNSPISNFNLFKKSSLQSEYSFESIRKTYSHKEVIHWNIKRVVEWLKEMNMEMYQQLFVMNEIDGEALLELEDIQDFYFLKIMKLGHIKKLQKYIKIMRETQ